MPYPSLNVGVPTFDQYGNQCEVNPLVQRGTAGALAPGQSLFSACGRVSTQTGSATTVPLVTVPSNQVLFVTDFDCSTAGSLEVDVQLQSGSIAIDRAAVLNTSPCNIMHETQPMVIPTNTLAIVLGQTASAQNVNFLVAGYLQAIGQ